MTAASSTLDSIAADRMAYRRYAVLALYGQSAFWGIAQLFAVNNALLYMANMVAFATSATLWFEIDCRMLAKSRLPILRLLFFFAWPIASLIYLMASRGVREVGYWLLHVVGLFATMCLTFFLAMFLLYWLGMLNVEVPAKPYNVELSGATERR